jgi:hypothetical protein
MAGAEKLRYDWDHMRTLATLIVLIAAAVTFAQTGPALTALEQGVLGSWKSPEIDPDFPFWMVETYRADGTVQEAFYSKMPGKAGHRNFETPHVRWRIANDLLEVGKVNDEGEFKREGQPRRIRTSASGKVASIGGWTRVAATQPTSQPSSQRAGTATAPAARPGGAGGS